MNDEQRIDAEDIKELRRIQTDLNKCYQRAKETESNIDWGIWNDMLELWYSRCADSGDGLLRTIDRLAAGLDAARAETAKLREACEKTLTIAADMEEEFDNLGYDDCIDRHYVEDIRLKMFTVGVGNRKDIEAAIVRIEEAAKPCRVWITKTHYWDERPIPPEDHALFVAELEKHEANIVALRAALGVSADE